LILWDEAKKAWRNITVEDFVVRWVDNGLTANVTHLVQEYTDAFEPIAVPKEVNLSLFKWFQSPVQEIDAQTMKRNREKKRWEDAITDIDSVAQKEIEMLKSELDDYRKSQEQLFKRSKKRIMKAFERTLMQRANDTADSNIASRALTVYHVSSSSFRHLLYVIDSKAHCGISSASSSSLSSSSLAASSLSSSSTITCLPTIGTGQRGLGGH